MEMSAVVMAENEELQKLINEAKYSKILSDLRNMYGNRWKNYKDTFYCADPKKKKRFNCYGEEMYGKGQQESLKKILFEETYNEVAKKYPTIP